MKFIIQKIFSNFIIFFAFFNLASCSKALVEVTVIDQRTALENQVLGSYKELSKDVMLMASVRSIDEYGKLIPVPKIPKGKKEVLKALQRRDFNKDDIEIFKATSVAGETNKGLLKFFETKETNQNRDYETFIKAIIAEENEDRLTVMQRIVNTNENFKEGELSKVQKIFASLNRDNAQKGELIQLEDGNWILKK